MTFIWYLGETKEYVLTVTTGGEAQDLTAASLLELRVSATIGGATLATLGLGTGIALRTQSGTTLGQALVTMAEDWLTDAALAVGVYYFYVVLEFPDSQRFYVIKPVKVTIREV